MPASTDQSVATILLVDDERQTLKYFERAFADEFDVLTAASADEAEALLQQHSERIGVVISDQRMPGRTGVHLLSLVRERHPNVVRILTTAYADLADAIEGVNSGQIFRYIVKPWDFDQLRQELKLALLIFNLQQERDLLVAEKMSVRLRQRAADRGRDILVIASGLINLRNARAGALSFLRDLGGSALTGHGPVPLEKLDMWSNIESETTALGNLASALSTRVEKLHAADWQQSLGSVPVHEVLKAAADELKTAAEGHLVRLPEIAASDASIHTRHDRLKMLCSVLLRAAIGSAAANSEVTAKLSPGTSGVVVTLGVSEKNKAGTNPLLLEPQELAGASDLLLAYLLCSDLGGSLNVKSTEANGLAYELQLPLRPTSKTAEPDSDSNWARGAFEALEQW